MNRRSFFGTIVGLASIPFIKSKVLPEPDLITDDHLLSRCVNSDPNISIPAQRELAKILSVPLIGRYDET